MDWATSFTKSYTTSGSDFITITEDLQQIRIGAKVTGLTGTGNKITMGLSMRN